MVDGLGERPAWLPPFRGWCDRSQQRPWYQPGMLWLGRGRTLGAEEMLV